MLNSWTLGRRLAPASHRAEKLLETIVGSSAFPESYSRMPAKNYVKVITLKRGRGERIRTSDSCVPNAVLYQAELHPELTVLFTCA